MEGRIDVNEKLRVRTFAEWYNEKHRWNEYVQATDQYPFDRLAEKRPHVDFLRNMTAEEVRMLPDSAFEGFSVFEAGHTIHFPDDESDKMKVGRVLWNHRGLELAGVDTNIIVGKSVADVLRKSSEDGEALQSIYHIDYDTIVSDYRIIEGKECEAYLCGVATGAAVRRCLIITIDGSTDRDNPNIKRYLSHGLTDLQAKTMHLRNLGFDQSEVAEMEGVSRVSITEREALGKRKMGCITVYWRC